MKAKCIWTITEIDTRTKMRRRVRRKKNIFTNYGLAALAQAISGSYVAPVFLTLDSFKGTLSASVAAGVSSIQTNVAIDQAGDTQLIIGLGTANQEAVSFSSRSGSGPYTYALSAATTKSHASGDYCARQVNINDLITSVTTSIQYDTVGAAGLWPGATSGYQSGNSWIQQWYMTAVQANAYITTVGLCDAASIGSGNLHNHLVLGIDHTLGTQDLEIDVSLTLTN